jgi:hypothetical protein
MKPIAVRRGTEGGVQDGDLAGRVLCHDIRGHRNEIVFRKGHALRAEDIALLADAPWTEIHVIELSSEEIGQREAGQRLASSLSSDGLQATPSGHRHVLKARHNGLVRIDVVALQRLNSVPGIAVYTVLNDQVAAKDQIVAEAQITQLAIDRRSIEAATEIAGEGGNVVRLLPFAPRDAVIWMRDDRHLSDLAGKLRWFGCTVREMIDLPREAAAIHESMEICVSSGSTLFLISGSNALDPLDPVFAAIESMGAKMQRIGMPVHPGTLLWIATLVSGGNAITIVGLPTCGLGTQVTAFDLILPKLLAEGGIRDEDLAALGHGGILSSGTAQAARGRA